MNTNFSFQKGWGQVTLDDEASVKNEIMEALKITSRVQWMVRLRGKVEPKISEVEAIEAIFHKRNIFEIWG